MTQRTPSVAWQIISNNMAGRVGEPVAARVKLNEKAELNIKETHNMAYWAEMGVVPVAQTADLESAWLLDFYSIRGQGILAGIQNFQVIMLYNNNIFYAMSVYQLADALHNARTMN